MAKNKAPRRPRAETPKGFRDYFGPDVTERKAMLDTIAGVYHRYGFDPLETSAVETLEALGKYLPDVDRPHAGVFAWQEDDEGGKGDWLALRYDLTAPLARVAAQYRNELAFPYRRYAMGPVWRNEKPGPGRYRQFYQCDADTVGAPSVAADAEICAMLAEVFEELGLGGKYIIRVNNRKVLEGVMEVAGILDPAEPSRFEAERGIVLRAIDKYDRLGEDGVRALLGEGRRDESGDFTEGAGLSDEQVTKIMRFVNAKSEIDSRMHRYWEAKGSPNIVHDNDPTAVALRSGGVGRSTQAGRAQTPESSNEMLKHTVAYLLEIVGTSEVGAEGVEELKHIAEILAAQGYPPDRIIIDPSVVRGLGYYTGPVYEAEITDEKGRSSRFGSVAGGGRYDDLVKRFTGQQVPATGVSIGVDRLLAALRADEEESGTTRGPVVVTVMDRARMAEYQAMAAELRAAGIRAEVYLGNPKNFGNQLKYADKRGAPVAVIQGEDEAARGVVQVKDLVLGAKMAEGASLEEWKSQPAQREVPREEMVAAIREILERG
ncbi:histidine--tRNA ligase [Rhodobacteraceae bacterium WD3A24]|nr:histidine--tRNA ligase [Rhodobacteraceae bacterium WD3A24]